MCSQLRIHSVLSMKLLATSAQGVYAPLGHLEPTEKIVGRHCRPGS